MAITDKNTIYSWFQTDDFPTEAQFRATWDSFWHKSESIPMSQITGLNQLFQQTATVAQLNNKANVDGSNIDVSAYQEKLNITNLIATAKEEVKTELLNGAPEAFDTLKEISDWISDDETAEAAILQAIQNEATARTNADNLKLNKPTATSNTTSYPFVVGEDGKGNSARLPAGDLGKNFFNSDLSNTTARSHTMNAGVTVNTLGNPHTLSGLPNKNTGIANFRKVRVQNASGLDSVVDSKNLLTDGVTSMTDAEKDAWRSAQRKTGENYSLATPRIDFIAPFKLGKDIAGVQYLSCIGSNLLLNLSDCEVKLINTTTNVEYPVSVINTSASTTSQFSFGYNISTLPIGFYRVYVRNMLLTNIVDTVTFEVVNTIVKKDLSTLTWQKAVFDGTFTNSIASGNSVYRQPQSTSGETLGSSQLSVRKIAFLSDVFLNSAEAKGNWQIEFSVNYSAPFYGNYSGGSRFGIVDGNVVTAPTISADILYGQITLSASHRWRLFPSNNSDTVDGQTNGKYSIVKTGSVIRMYQIIAGTRIQIATHTITSNFGSLRFFFAANGNNSTSYDMAITVNIDNVNI